MKNQSSNTWGQACRHALQWRLLLLWSLVLWLPILVFAVPTWLLLAPSLDYSVHAAKMAEHFDIAVIGDLVGILTRTKLEAFSIAVLGSLLFTLFLSPFLSGMAVTAWRLPQAAKMGELIRGGLNEYGRMLRVLIWGIVPFGLAIALGGFVIKLAQEHAEKAILYTDTLLASRAALGLSLLLLILAHTTVDAARAKFALDSGQRSAFKTGWSGLKMLLHRPFQCVVYYLSVSLIGLSCAAVLIFCRINFPHTSLFGFCIALLIMQLMVVVLAWMRNARLFALAAIARSQQMPTN
jgi:hypothetical protein